jgi:two-component system alkaline phosphatase synthesis response regulator PhoP
MKKVLLVDDEPSIVTLLAFNLEKDGYEVTTATDGAEGYRLAISNPFDFIILDLMLPSMDGMDICKRLRQEKFDTPIMILTAKDDELEKIIGLELGADDYMTKPFSPREVLARMKAILRRTNKAVPAEPVLRLSNRSRLRIETEKIEVGEITIFPQLYEVHVAGELIEITPKEFELLLYYLMPAE